MTCQKIKQNTVDACHSLNEHLKIKIKFIVLINDSYQNKIKLNNGLNE